MLWYMQYNLWKAKQNVMPYCNFEKCYKLTLRITDLVNLLSNKAFGGIHY